MARPTRLTPDLEERILALVRRGAYKDTACTAVGISVRTLYVWLRRAEDGGPYSTRYKRFADALEKAEAEAEALATATILLASKEDWRAAAWMMSRKHPERWGDKVQLQLQDGLRALLEEAELVCPPEIFAQLCARLSRKVSDAEAGRIQQGERAKDREADGAD